MSFNINHKTHSFTISVQSDSEFVEVVKHKIYNQKYRLFYSKDGKNVSIQFSRTIKQDNMIFVVDKLINTNVINLIIKDLVRTQYGSDDFEYSFGKPYSKGIWYKISSSCSSI